MYLLYIQGGLTIYHIFTTYYENWGELERRKGTTPSSIYVVGVKHDTKRNTFFLAFSFTRHTLHVQGVPQKCVL